MRQRLTQGLATTTRHAAGRWRFPFPFPERIFNVLESFIFHNRARDKSTGPRHAPVQTFPPGCNRSCQEASEQLGIEAGGTSQRVPAHGESSPGRGQPKSHHYISVPEKSPTRERRKKKKNIQKEKKQRIKQSSIQRFCAIASNRTRMGNTLQ